jgi:cell wall assembly regulator SMI1
VKAIWQRIESWLSQNAPPVLQSLRGGATEQDIASAEAALGQCLPSDYRESLLLHDGQEVNQFGCSPRFIYGLDLFPLTKVITRWQWMSELLDQGLGQDLSIPIHGPVRAIWWDKCWIPIAGDDDSFCCLDLNPAAGGHVGQIIQVWKESHLRAVQSKSLREWLTVFAELLEVGEYVYSESHHGLISLEEAIAEGIVEP